jgi:hypothetical protein
LEVLGEKSNRAGENIRKWWSSFGDTHARLKLLGQSRVTSQEEIRHYLTQLDTVKSWVDEAYNDYKKKHAIIKRRWRNGIGFGLTAAERQRRMQQEQHLRRLEQQGQ